MTVIRPRPLGTPARRLRRPVGLRAGEQAGSIGEPRGGGRHWASHYRVRLTITDTVIVLASVSAAFMIRFGAGDVVPNLLAFPFGYGAISLLIVGAWLAALTVGHTRDSRVVGMGLSEYKLVAESSALAFGLLAILFLIAQVDIARGYFLIALPIGAAGLIVSRWGWRRWLLRQRRFDNYLSRALVVGSADDIEYVTGQIRRKSGAAYNVVGAVPDEPGLTTVGADGDQLPVVADLDGITAAADRLGVDTVIVAGQPRGGSRFIRNLGWALEGTATDLVLASRLTDVAGPRIHFRPVEGLPLIHVEIPQFEGGKHVLKRLLDVVVSAAALVVLALPMLVLGVIIRLDSAGPALFRQERVGRNGSTFTMLKFRSMAVDAEARLAALQKQNEGSGLLFKMKHDPRVTRVGRIIRKFSLDEFPQLWNVLVGDMSLVGPRPPLRREVDGYESHVHRRLYIKPGLTGMWQVNGRSDLSWEESVRLDLYYVENWSLAGDLVILWRTAKVLLQPTGAY